MRVAALLLLIASASTAAAQPETRGSHPVADFDAGRVALAGVQIPVHVYHPSDISTPVPVVAVVHGFLRNGSFMAEMARTLASRGMVAVVPDMPCGLGGCDHAANADQIRALLAWASADPVISGRVDPTRRGVIGHSWGALATFLATAQAGAFEVAVLLDPNDDRGVAAGIAGTTRVPTAVITAEIGGNCNNQWMSSIFTATPAPKLMVRVKGAAHCDAEEPSDNLCPIGCGRGDPSKSVVFRRYAVAFVACVLERDRSVAPWVEGAARSADEAAGVIDQASGDGLAALPCLAGAAPADAGATVGGDASSPASDGGASPNADAAPVPDDASVAGSDDATSGAGDASGGDAGVAADVARGGDADASIGGSHAEADGCQAVGGSTGLAVGLLALAALASRRRR